MEVEAADTAVAVEHFANEIKPGDFSGFHRAVIDFVEGHAPGGNLGIIPASVAKDREREGGETFDERAAGIARELSARD